MSYREIRRIISSYLFFYAAILCVPFILAIYYQFRIGNNTHPQPHSTLAFALTIGICLGLAWLLNQKNGKELSMIYRQREALASVAIIWILTPAIGALPFIFSGTLERFDQAYFEATSGFTTTGATVLEGKNYDPETRDEIPIQRFFCGTNVNNYTFYGNVTPIKDPFTGKRLEGIEAVGHALLFWRSLMQWIGGMGIIVLFVALLPEIGSQGKFLFQTETPGPVKDGFKPRVKETALQLWVIYACFTFLETIILLIINHEISFFDAITLSFSTLSTGGFSVHNQNLAYYHDAKMEWIIIIFMMLGSINFSLYYHIFRGKLYRIFDPELLGYLIILGAMGSFTVFQLWNTPQISISGENLGNYTFTEALRMGIFQLVSTQTSTGFFVTPYDLWPYSVQVILLVAMYLGGMSGSTAGGMKIIRIQVLLKIAKAKIESIFQPKVIKNTHLGQKEIDETTAFSVLCFFLIAMAISVLSTFLYVCDDIDPETALGLTACMVNNTGIAFKAAGPQSTMAFLSPFSTYLSSFLMILGRLEYYALLAVLIPSFWRRN